MTPFQQAVQQVEAGKLQAPEVSMSGSKINYFNYQLAVHKYNLSLMAKGLKFRGIKLSDLKHYYGLKGRTAADVLPQFLKLMDDYQNRTINN